MVSVSGSSAASTFSQVFLLEKEPFSQSQSGPALSQERMGR